MLLCVGITLSDVDCTLEWEQRNNLKVTKGKRHHPTASTLAECQKACEFDPRCVAIDWKSKDRRCELNTDPNHKHGSNSNWDHYHLVSRCNITLGECFDSNVVANVNLLKTI